MSLPDSIRRAARTFLWAFFAAIAGSGVLSATAEEAIVDWSSLKKVGISAAFAGLAALVAWVMNALEDKNVIPEIIPK